MHIVHIVLAGLMTDGASYQENLLSKYHRRLGHSVTVLALQWSLQPDGTPGLDRREAYLNADGVKVVRLPMRGREDIRRRLKRVRGLAEALRREQPDVLFVHGCQFLDADVVSRYAADHGTLMYVDNHADFSNSAQSFLSREVLHKLLWRHKAHVLAKHARRFYGVLPARVDFLREVYALAPEQCALLLMGADDDEVTPALVDERRSEIRGQYHLQADDFLIVTGGKIDAAKRQTLLLAEAVHALKDARVKLLIFGSVEPSLQAEMDRLCDGETVFYVGWASTSESYGYFSAADLIVFPGRHSVYWEQAAGAGRPMLVKYWQGTTHVDRGGNVRFLHRDSAEEIRQAIETLLTDPTQLEAMKAAAMEARTAFSYAEIARRSLEDAMPPEKKEKKERRD